MPQGASSEVFRVLVLYQYDHNQGEPEIIEEFIRGVRGAEHHNRMIVAEKLIDSPGCGPELQTFMESFGHACEGFDFVVAFVTPDRRPASEAGNLWLEIGYWIARHRFRKILVLKPEGPGVQLPSNLGGYIYKSVRDGTDAVNKFLLRLKGLDIDTPSRPPDHDPETIRKIKKVMNGTQHWPDEDFSQCRGSQTSPHCHGKLPALGLIAELAQFNQAMRTLGMVMACLMEFLRKAHVVQHDVTTPWPSKQGLLLQMQYDAQALYEVTIKEYADLIRDDWVRWLGDYLVERDCGRADACGRFAEATRKFADGTFKDLILRLKKVADEPGLTAALFDINCLQVTALNGLGQHAREHCNSIHGAIEKFLGSQMDFHDLPRYLRECVDDFAHNKSMKPSIW